MHNQYTFVHTLRTQQGATFQEIVQIRQMEARQNFLMIGSELVHIRQMAPVSSNIHVCKFIVRITIFEIQNVREQYDPM